MRSENFLLDLACGDQMETSEREVKERRPIAMSWGNKAVKTPTQFILPESLAVKRGEWDKTVAGSD